MLKVNYLTVPLLLEFNTNSNPNKSIHFALGPILGYRIGKIKLKQKYEATNNEVENTIKKNYNINDFQYGLALRAGYSKVNVFATYNFSTMFKFGKTLAVNPFTVGVSLIPF
jgi:hypothetical protein